MAFFKTSEERQAELEAKINEIETQASDEVKNRQEEESLTPDEKTYKKRYGDLRSHTSKLENQLRSEINELKNQLTVATKKEINFPKTTEEVSAWAAKYPEIYDTIVTIARQNAIDVQKDIETKVQQFEVDKHENAKALAYQLLISAHPDFPDIATDQEFIDWTESQPKYIYDALYVNETDAASAIRAVDLYKSDRGMNKKKEAPKTTDTRDAARKVPSGEARTVNDGNQPKWTESRLQGVNWNRLTEAQLAEIEEASQNPAFYDISGGAR